IVYSMLSKKGREIFFPKSGILAQSAEAKDKDINATIGIAFKEDNSPLTLDIISKKLKLKNKNAFTYAPSYGKLELREKWKKMILKKNPSLSDNITLPIITNGITHGLSVLSYLFVEDEIIIPEPYWGNYNLIFQNGFDAEIKKFSLFSDGFNIDGLEKMLNSEGEKKVLLLNFPNNPTGYTPIKNEAEKIAGIIKNSAKKGKKIVVISDDAYFGLVYEEGVYSESIFSKLANIHKNVLAVKVDGVTKEDYAWGFRIGFITFGTKEGSEKLYSALADKTAGVVRRSISSACHLSQTILLDAFEDHNYENEKNEKYKFLKNRYNMVKKVLKKYDNKYFDPLPFNSGYFMCLKLKRIDAEKVRQKLLKKYNTGVIAIDDKLRIAFSSTPLSKIEKLFNNIYLTCKEEMKRKEHQE
ncbi:MAG: aminotransferase class I/II-fold pyridoxal phosphate-dependent enzyme, partial [Candidatus Marinimicrobia bacterium]|nr:aminotransferase class I/II-fold pyridoxal phosphate-dependent enzyme [Candidatus Neomarinimicrobiota bacterium]